MSDRNKYLLVCQITTGKSFPEKKNAKIVIEGRFTDHNILLSDPVPQTANPRIDTELAWELDKKALHEHKMQRTPIKLNVFSISDKSKELLGYIILDLRTAGLNTCDCKWMNLLNTKYTKFKSELLIGLGVEDQGEAVVNNVNDGILNKSSGKLSVEKMNRDGKPFLQVGKGGDMYTFGLSIVNGAQLVNLMPSKLQLAAPFYWFYSLHGNDVCSSNFDDLNKPSLERALINIQSTKENLLRFLTAELNNIEIHLCSDDISLGSTILDYSNGLHHKYHQTDLNKETIAIEDEYPLQPSGKTGGRIGASVKIEVTISKEGAIIAPQPSSSGQLPTPKISKDYDTDHGIEEIRSGRLESVESSDGLTTTESHIQIPPVAHHFTFSLELLSLKCELSKCRVQLKYRYPFFGSAKFERSGPPVQLTRKNEEIKFLEPFCQFSFACTPAALTTQFHGTPLVLDLMAESDDAKTEVVAHTVLPLQKLIPFNQPRVMCDDLAVQAGNKLIGSLKLKYWLEDKGPIHQQIILPPKNDPPPREIQTAPEPPRDTKSAQFQAALELEMWKAEQEEAFELKMKQKEKSTLLKLSEEFAHRESEREALMQRRVSEYEKMEKQLKRALQEAKKGELVVLEQEKELARLRDDLQKEKDRIRQDVKTTIEQQKRELNGILKVERAKTIAAEERSKLYRAELENSEGKYKKLLRELEDSKRSLPDPHLQAEIRSLLLDKSELEKKVDTLTKAKTHYKQQWNRAIKELSLAKQREQESAMERVKRQQAELDEMRLKYTIYNEEKIAKQEHNTLQTMKNELHMNSQPCRDTDVNEHAKRLQDEREQLLKSGVYMESDRIIQEINHQIKEICLDA